jgi:hypothetical protein
MGLRAAFMVNTVVGLVFGVGFALVPGLVLSIFGIKYDNGTIYVGQVLGATLIALSTITWFAKESSDWKLVRAILAGLLIFEVIGLVATVLAVLGGVTNALGWFIVLVLVTQALPRIYFLFVKPVGK